MHALAHTPLPHGGNWELLALQIHLASCASRNGTVQYEYASFVWILSVVSAFLRVIVRCVSSLFFSWLSKFSIMCICHALFICSLIKGHQCLSFHFGAVKNKDMWMVFCVCAPTCALGLWAAADGSNVGCTMLLPAAPPHCSLIRVPGAPHPPTL